MDTLYTLAFGEISLRDVGRVGGKNASLGELFVVQARPETVHSSKSRMVAAEVFTLTGTPGRCLTTGQAVGERIGAGPVRVVRDPSGLSSVEASDVLVAESTNPDWEPVMRRVAAIVTDQGGRRAHAAIVSRELGLPCVVGAGDATTTLTGGTEVTVCCAEGPEGRVYEGVVPFEIERIEATDLPKTRTQIMLNVGDPENAFKLAKEFCP
jgi:pyruvate, water dikinase